MPRILAASIWREASGPASVPSDGTALRFDADRNHLANEVSVSFEPGFDRRVIGHACERIVEHCAQTRIGFYAAQPAAGAAIEMWVGDL